MKILDWLLLFSLCGGLLGLLAGAIFSPLAFGYLTHDGDQTAVGVAVSLLSLLCGLGCIAGAFVGLFQHGLLDDWR